MRGLYWATLGGCDVPNRIKGLAIGVISMLGYFPEMYLPLLSAPLLEMYPGTLGYQIYYVLVALCGLAGAYAAFWQNAASNQKNLIFQESSLFYIDKN